MAAKPPPKPGQKKPAAPPGLPFPGAKPPPGKARPDSKTPAKPMKKTGK